MEQDPDLNQIQENDNEQESEIDFNLDYCEDCLQKLNEIGLCDDCDHAAIFGFDDDNEYCDECSGVSCDCNECSSDNDDYSDQYQDIEHGDFNTPITATDEKDLPF